MSPTSVISEEIVIEDGQTLIVTKKKPGDFVVCTLSSISLARAYRDDVLERLVKIQVRMLDNAITENNLPIPQAEIMDEKYRAVN